MALPKSVQSAMMRDKKKKETPLQKRVREAGKTTWSDTIKAAGRALVQGQPKPDRAGDPNKYGTEAEYRKNVEEPRRKGKRPLYSP